MEIILIERTDRPMIRILNTQFQRLGVIKRAISALRVEEINGENTLEFTAILDEKLNRLVNDNSIFEIEDDYFDIAILNKHSNDDGTYTIEVEAEHVSYRLNQTQYDLQTFLGTGTPYQVLIQILQDTGFSVNIVEFPTTPYEYDIRHSRSRRALLIDYVDLLKGEVLFNRFTVSVLQKRGTQIPRAAVKGKNVKVISREMNKRKLDLNNQPTISYTCQPVSLPRDLYELGDAVTLIDKEIGVREALRVVRYGYNPYLPTETVLVFGNYIGGFERPIHEVSSAVNDVSDRISDIDEWIEDIEEEIEEISEQMPQRLRLTEYDFHFHSDGIFETNFEAIDTTKYFPIDGHRRFIRLKDDKLQWVDATLEEFDEEDPDKVLDNQMKSLQGEPIYWTEIDNHSMDWTWIVNEGEEDEEEKEVVVRWTKIDHEPYSRATILDPFDFRSVMIPSGVPLVEVEKIRAELRHRYAVTIRSAVEEHIIAEIGPGENAAYLIRYLEDEAIRGIRITDDGITQFTDSVSGEWKDMETGGELVIPGPDGGPMFTSDGKLSDNMIRTMQLSGFKRIIAFPEQPTQIQIDELVEHKDIVVVYDRNNPYIPGVESEIVYEE